MSPARWKAPAVLLVITLGACGSSPPVTYYDLQALETGYAAGRDKVNVGVVKVPDPRVDALAELFFAKARSRRRNLHLVAVAGNRSAQLADDFAAQLLALVLGTVVQQCDPPRQVIKNQQRLWRDEGRVQLRHLPHPARVEGPQPVPRAGSRAVRHGWL